MPVLHPSCLCCQAHATCSEPFYERTLLAEVQSGDGPNSDEKREMLKIIQRLADAEEDGSEDGEQDNELAQKLEGVDLGKLSTRVLSVD
jgi:hypothetical protein